MRRPLIVVVLLGLMLASCAATADPASTLEEYASAYNADDMEALMEHFSEESVITGHPSGLPSATGLTAILALQVSDRDGAALENALAISNIEVTGTAVTWHQSWTNDRGQTWCKSGHDAVVENGVILSWSWLDTSYDC